MKNKISPYEMTCCPHCGGDYGFYYSETVYGKIHINNSWNGQALADNSSMFDFLKTKKIYKKMFCLECNKYVGDYDESYIHHTSFNIESNNDIIIYRKEGNEND